VGPIHSEVREAQERYQEFTGHDANEARKVKVRIPRVAVEIGDLDGVLYTTVRDGRTEKYVHKFKRNSRPVLAAGSDGKTLHVIGGDFEFTERGIVDR
jgi:hypothetical protein